MARRMFRVIETGQWCGAVLSDAAFADDGTEYADRVAEGLGLAAGALEVVDLADEDPDPRSGDLLLPDEPEPEAPSPVVDLNAFKLALFQSLGIPAAAAIAAAGYLPLFTEALNARNWAVARGIVDAALAGARLRLEVVDDFHGADLGGAGD